MNQILPLLLGDRLSQLAAAQGVGGENVYTNDVAEVVLSHPDVADACVIAKPDDPLGSVLTALVQPRAGTTPTPEDIAGHCQHRLAPHMVPQEVRLVERLPRSAAGKLLRAKLSL